MGLRCLSCSKDTAEDKVCIVREVLICIDCNAQVQEFLKLVMNDLRSIDRQSNGAVRKGLLSGSFVGRSWSVATTFDRISLLIGLMERVKEQPCLTSPIPISSLQSSSSGEPLLPHVSTLTGLAAAGRKRSNFPTG